MNLLTEIALDGLLSAVAAAGFAVISNPPRKAVYLSALLAAIGHSLRYFLIQTTEIDIVTATVIATFTIGMMTIFFAKLIHCPPEVFSFPSLLPMIPGMYAYKTFMSLMYFIRADDPSTMQAAMLEILHNGALTVSILFALVLGVSLPLFIFRRQSFLITRIMHNRHRALKNGREALSHHPAEHIEQDDRKNDAGDRHVQVVPLEKKSENRKQYAQHRSSQQHDYPCLDDSQRFQGFQPHPDTGEAAVHRRSPLESGKIGLRPAVAHHVQHAPHQTNGASRQYAHTQHIPYRQFHRARG